jgi:alpha-tubulin suppressor-like RCC1 family protein
MKQNLTPPWLRLLIAALVAVPFMAEAQALQGTLSSNGQHNLLLLPDGTLRAWGSNTLGQLGDGTTNQRTTPVPVGTATNWAGLSSGENHNLALRADGTIWAWGNNGVGQLGDGTTTTRLTPSQVGTGTTWKQATAIA